MHIMTTRARAFLLALLLGVVGSQASAQTAAPAPGQPQATAGNKQDFSPAEKTLLMTDQLSTLKPPMQLVYSFQHSGTLEAGYQDRVTLRLKARAGDKPCCAADADFLSGERKVDLPTIDDAAGNPVTLYFLEYDIRDMKRLTKGASNYFRKRIRMALYDGASIDAVSFAYKGKTVAGRQITVEPYRDDPNRARFENMVRKRYVFTLSDDVPGVLAAIRTVVPGASADAALLRDDLVLDGVVPPPLPSH